MIKILLILLLMTSSAFAKDEVKMYDKTGSYIGKTVQQPEVHRGLVGELILPCRNQRPCYLVL
jgi:hypothetical protein